MAKLTYIAAAAIIAAADSATGGGINPEAPLATIASCLIAIVDRLLAQQWAVPEIRASKAVNETLPTVLHFLRRQDPDA